MKTCVNCQSTLREGARFCASCGTKIEEVAVNTDETFTPSQQKISNHHLETEKIKAEIKKYWHFFVTILKRPGSLSNDTPKYYAYITISLNVVLGLFVSYKIMKSSGLYGYGSSSSIYYTTPNQMLNQSLFTLFFFSLFSLVLLFGILYLLENYVFKHSISFNSIINHYANYLALPIVLLFILILFNALDIFSLQWNIWIIVLIGLIYTIIPAVFVLKLEGQNKHSYYSPLYQVLITYLAIGLVSFIFFKDYLY